MMTELMGNVGYLIIILLLYAVFSLFWSLVAQRRMKKQIAEAEKRISLLKREQEDVSEDLVHRMEALKKSIDDTTNRLLNRFSEILGKVNTSIDETRKSVSGEIADMINPTKASFNETHHALKKGMTDHRKEMQRLSQKLEDLSKDVQRMKVDLRERTIDLEL
jgi:DNA anti-recombination protein RmuC